MKKSFSRWWEWVQQNSPFILLSGLGLLWGVVCWELSVEWDINPQYTHGWLVPLLVGYLIYLRVHELPPTGKGSFSTNVVLIVLGVLLLILFPLRVIQIANPDWRLMSWAVSLIAYGVSLLTLVHLGGVSWVRHFALPLALIFLGVPWPTFLENALIQNLMQTVAALTVELMHWLGIYAVQEGNLIRLREGVLGVDEACSGVRSFQSTLMAALFLGELYRLKVLFRVALLIFGWVAAFILNVGRSCWLTASAAWSGMDSVGFWHDPAGLTILIIVFIFLWGGASYLAGESLLQDEKTSDEGGETSLFAMLKMSPLFATVLLFGVIAVILFSEGWYYLGKHEKAVVDQWSYQDPGVHLGGKEIQIPPVVHSLLRYSEGTASAWKDSRGQQYQSFYFRWKPGRAALQLARGHSPEICMPAAGLQLLQEQEGKFWKVNGLDVPVREYVFGRGKFRVYVYRVDWEESGKQFFMDDTRRFYSRAERLRSAWEGRRQDGQRVLQLMIFGDDRIFQERFSDKIQLEMRAKAQRTLEQLILP